MQSFDGDEDSFFELLAEKPNYVRDMIESLTDYPEVISYIEKKLAQAKVRLDAGLDTTRPTVATSSDEGTPAAVPAKT